MNKKDKLTLFISLFLFIIINLVSLLHSLLNIDDYGQKTGNHMYRTSFYEDQKVPKWDIAISKMNIKSNITETAENMSYLMKFKTVIRDISTKKIHIVSSISMLALLFIILFLYRKEKKTYNIGFLKGAVVIAFGFYFYKLMISLLDLGMLFKDAAFYYNCIG